MRRSTSSWPGLLAVLLSSTQPQAGRAEQPGAAAPPIERDRYVDATQVFAAGDLYAVDSIVGNLRYVPAGTFTQGSPPGEACRSSDEAQLQHTLTRNIAVMETELTRGMWASLRAVQPTLPADTSDGLFTCAFTGCPVNGISWYEAVLFANLLSLQQGLSPCYYTDSSKTTLIQASNYNGRDAVYWDFGAGGYRLPTEGEWEHLARAGTSTPFSVNEPGYGAGTCASCTGGLQTYLEAVAFLCTNDAGVASPVGGKLPNPWNLRDVHGNLSEWCWDCYGAYHTGAVVDDTGPLATGIRVFRGGSFVDPSKACRSAARGYSLPSSGTLIGARLVRTLGTCALPAVVEQPQSQGIGSGATATLSVSASGPGPIHVQWYAGARGDTSGPVGTDSTSYTTPSLSVSTPFWARLTNNCGITDSDTATITVSQGAGLSGDADGDGVVTPADVFYLINFLYAGGPQPL